MRKIVLAAFLAAAPALLAQSADLRITTLNVDRTSLQQGERFAVLMRWRNFGPDVAEGVVAELGRDSGAFVVRGAGTSGWPCEPAAGAGSFVCHGIIAPGGEADMVVTLRAPARGTSFVLRATVRADTFDPAPENNSRQTTLELAPAPVTADLSVSPREQTHVVAPGASVTIPLTVRGSATGEAQNVSALLGFAPGLLIPISATGEGWTCANPTHSPWLVVCTRPRLGDVEAPIVVQGTAPQANGTYPFTARIAAELTHDPSAANDLATAVVQVGPAGVPPPQPQPEIWRRILVPLPSAQAPGANGALWTIATSIVTNGVAIEPNVFPTNAPFFVYVREADAPHVHLNSRVWDVSRETETAGSEVPIVREHRFSASAQSILGIPVAPQYRHTLRVYDFDGRTGTRVAIRVYVNDEPAPRASVERTLAAASNATTPTAQLPLHPAYLQLDPASLASLTGATTMRIEIQPLEEGVRLWSFVSATNNNTHHVTTFTAR
jgi:hypothetical protein